VLASLSGGVQPRWGRDQTELYYLSLEGDLMAVPIDLAAGARLGPPAKLFKPAVRNSQGSLARGRRSTYTPPLFDVAADGRFLVASVQPEVEAPVPVTVLLHSTTRLNGRSQR
jgi:hypothetical protein